MHCSKQIFFLKKKKKISHTWILLREFSSFLFVFRYRSGSQRFFSCFTTKLQINKKSSLPSSVNTVQIRHQLHPWKRKKNRNNQEVFFNSPKKWHSTEWLHKDGRGTNVVRLDQRVDSMRSNNTNMKKKPLLFKRIKIASQVLNS